MRALWRSLALSTALAMQQYTPALAVDLHGYAGLQARAFPDAPLYSGQDRFNPSASARLEARWRWGSTDFELTPFLRIDGSDPERTHADVRELSARFSTRGWDWNIGVGKVFWGVAESRHLVDVVNQTDFVEDIDEEEKLGQPMVHAVRLSDWGTLELLMLPGFRERTYPGERGRLYLPIDTDHPVYESNKERRHIDWAARWSNSYRGWDLGLSYFHGTRRDPRLEPDFSRGLAIPHYDLIHQVGLDLQGAVGDWVWKLETFYRDTPLDDYAALVGGFEYTLYGIFDNGKDLGLIAEYLYDGRESTLETPFQDDLFLGLRLNLNDAQGTHAIVGLVVDLDHDSLFWRVEASRRLGQDWTLGLELQGFPRTEPGEPIHFWRRDGYVQLELRRYF